LTTEELFTRLAPHVGPLLHERFDNRSLCILATRTVIDVAAYFGLLVHARPVQALVCNRIYVERVGAADDLRDVDWNALFASGGHSVGIGFGLIEGRLFTDVEMAVMGKWNGHLVAFADGVMGDFTIRQAQRQDKGIVVGDAMVGPWRDGAEEVSFQNCTGTSIWYRDHANTFYRQGPDWRDPQRRKPLVAELIRRVR
jgi:hypothetical protein